MVEAAGTLPAGGNPLETPGMCGMCATSIGLGEAKTRIAGTATQPCYLKYDEFLETVVQDWGPGPDTAARVLWVEVWGATHDKNSDGGQAMICMQGGAMDTEGAPPASYSRLASGKVTLPLLAELLPGGAESSAPQSLQVELFAKEGLVGTAPDAKIGNMKLQVKVATSKGLLAEHPRKEDVWAANYLHTDGAELKTPAATKQPNSTAPASGPSYFPTQQGSLQDYLGCEAMKADKILKNCFMVPKYNADGTPAVGSVSGLYNTEAEEEQACKTQAGNTFDSKGGLAKWELEHGAPPVERTTAIYGVNMPTVRTIVMKHNQTYTMGGKMSEIENSVIVEKENPALDGAGEGSLKKTLKLDWNDGVGMETKETPMVPPDKDKQKMYKEEPGKIAQLTTPRSGDGTVGYWSLRWCATWIDEGMTLAHKETKKAHTKHGCADPDKERDDLKIYVYQSQKDGADDPKLKIVEIDDLDHQGPTVDPRGHKALSDELGIDYWDTTTLTSYHQKTGKRMVGNPANPDGDNSGFCSFFNCFG